MKNSRILALVTSAVLLAVMIPVIVSLAGESPAYLGSVVDMRFDTENAGYGLIEDVYLSDYFVRTMDYGSGTYNGNVYYDSVEESVYTEPFDSTQLGGYTYDDYGVSDLNSLRFRIEKRPEAADLDGAIYKYVKIRYKMVSSSDGFQLMLRDFNTWTIFNLEDPSTTTNEWVEKVVDLSLLSGWESVTFDNTAMQLYLQIIDTDPSRDYTLEPGFRFYLQSLTFYEEEDDAYLEGSTEPEEPPPLTPGKVAELLFNKKSTVSGQVADAALTDFFVFRGDIGNAPYSARLGFDETEKSAYIEVGDSNPTGDKYTVRLRVQGKPGVTPINGSDYGYALVRYMIVSNAPGDFYTLLRDSAWNSYPVSGSVQSNVWNETLVDLSASSEWNSVMIGDDEGTQQLLFQVINEDEAYDCTADAGFRLYLQYIVLFENIDEANNYEMPEPEDDPPPYIPPPPTDPTTPDVSEPGNGSSLETSEAEDNNTPGVPSNTGNEGGISELYFDKKSTVSGQVADEELSDFFVFRGDIGNAPYSARLGFDEYEKSAYIEVGDSNATGEKFTVRLRVQGKPGVTPINGSDYKYALVRYKIVSNAPGDFYTLLRDSVWNSYSVSESVQSNIWNETLVDLSASNEWKSVKIGDDEGTQQLILQIVNLNEAYDCTADAGFRLYLQYIVLFENIDDAKNYTYSESGDASPEDIAEPDTSEPDISEPDISEPDISEPNTTEPDTSEPDTTQPDTSEPDTDTPGSSSSAEYKGKVAALGFNSKAAVSGQVADEQLASFFLFRGDIGNAAYTAKLGYDASENSAYIEVGNSDPTGDKNSVRLRIQGKPGVTAINGSDYNYVLIRYMIASNAPGDFYTLLRDSAWNSYPVSESAQSNVWHETLIDLSASNEWKGIRIGDDEGTQQLMLQVINLDEAYDCTADAGFRVYLQYIVLFEDFDDIAIALGQYPDSNLENLINPKTGSANPAVALFVLVGSTVTTIVLCVTNKRRVRAR